MTSKKEVIMMAAQKISGDPDFKIEPEVIFYTLRKFDWRFELPEYRDDILQEIRLVLLCFPEDEIIDLFKKSASAARRLLYDFGRGRRKPEMNFSTLSKNVDPGHQESFLNDFFLTRKDRRERLDENERAVLEAVLSFYETHTARETCKELGIDCTPRIQKLLVACAPKHTQDNKNKSRLTFAERQRLEFFFKRGLSVEKAAAEIGRNRASVFYELKRCSLTRDNYDAREAQRVAEVLAARGHNNLNRSIALEERQRLEYFFQQGLSVPEAAEKLGRHPGTIWRELQRVGMTKENYDAREAQRIYDSLEDRR